ncbi:hypothetical protein A2955_01320 [Candidatus Woesebacteria bacterium RIFCSPLOWO2_01_FULL_37_19]|uniref:Uncharacterized protein n=2 Tax=Candidatus Woeseibacteriota TaxID=1752722 RepID=A0A1F8B240_9BACT|nr:MAG: hypothetical protein A2771_03510 [Candidatus Woesebacteria bacterium RIFCSPHIGHO2_01_FULL_38_26b]OGM58066.1 MAG: hypothetical protein A2955_01320 [Candidatus Woesebacteria bacterium RIFCSPLOWO2_01_FULL_37_19]
MAAQKKEVQINLLPEKGFESSTTGRILGWILSTFRIIVIVTEIIVMIAFLSRFWLDAQNTDLTEEIQRKKAVLVASQDSDKEFRDVQKRLKIYNALIGNEKIISKSINLIRTYLPDELYLTSIAYAKDEITINGLTPSERGLQQFIVNLDSTDLYEEVSLLELKSSQDNPSLLQFSLKSTVKQNTN